MAFEVTWTVRDQQRIYGPFRTAADAGRWMVEYKEALSQPSVVEAIFPPDLIGVKSNEG